MAPLPDDNPEKKRLKSHLNSVIDAFNTGLDAAFDLGLEVGKDLVKIGRIKEPKTPVRDFGADVRELISERAERITALEKMD